MMTTNGAVKLMLFLSHNGVFSRRKAMEAILQGRISVNANVVREPSTPVIPGKDRVEVNGRSVGERRVEYYMLNKPKGYVTTKADRHAEKTILELVPDHLRHLNPVGRLDQDTEGLLLLTNDGELTHRMTHPRFSIEKTYFVKADGFIREEDIRRLEKGIFIDDKKTAPAKIELIGRGRGETKLRMTIHEGRKRQIRLMLDKAGHRVVELKRVAHGPLTLGTLRTGRFRKLEDREIIRLRRAVGL